MRLVAAAVLLAASAGLASAGSQADVPREESQRTPDQPGKVPDSCPVTKLPEHPFLPPAPYLSDGNSWIGSPRLWTFIPEGGIWRGLPHYRWDDPRFRQKLFWWSEGYEGRTENPPELVITGKRLDGAAPPLGTDEHANAGWTNDGYDAFMVTGIFIPTLGCWEITGQYKGEQLSYVVWVARPECTPTDLLTLIKADDPAYADAMDLAERLNSHGFIVECVLQSKMIDIFEGQEGAALFKTDRGDFEALFLPKPETFASVEAVEHLDEHGRFLYSFKGTPPPRSPNPLNSAEPMFFGKHANQFFITRGLEPVFIAWGRELAASLVVALR
jgi:hypothetical protein